MERATLLAVWFLLIFGGLVPYVAIKSARALRRGATVPPRKRLFRNTVLMEVFFLGVSLFSARELEIPLFQRGTLRFQAVLAGLAVVVAGLALMPLLWRASSEAEKRRALLIRPGETRDLGWWFLVSLAAGTVEEITYRGVMVAVLLPFTRNWWLAIAISVLLFTLGHANQRGWRLVFIAALAFMCHLLVWLTGALYLAMAVHFTYDFLAGILYVRFAKQMPPSPETAPDQAAP